MPVTLDQILAATRGRLPDAPGPPARAVEREAGGRRPPARRSARRARGATAVAVIAEVKRRSPSAGLDPGGSRPGRARPSATRGTARRRSRCSPTARSSAARSTTCARRSARAAVPCCGRTSSSTSSSRRGARGGRRGGAAHRPGAGACPARASCSPARRRRPRGAGGGAHRRELTRALDAGAAIVGVNSRDLDTFRIDTAAAWTMLRAVPARCVAVAESGMASVADVERAAAAGADAVLIGTALSAAADPDGSSSG